jgi:hypothetical protein
MHETETNDVARRGRRRSRFGLLAVNGALLLALGAVTFGPTGTAQVRVRGDYTMVAGGVQGANANAVYVVDTVNQEMIVVSYEPSLKELVGVGYRNLTTDAASLARRGSSR